MAAVTFSQIAKADSSCSAVIVSSDREILQLAGSVRHLLHWREPNATPAFFSASVESQSWIPRVVIVRRGTAIRGLLYAKERKLAGLPTGLIYADASLDCMVLSAAGDAVEVLKIGAARLLSDSRVKGLRILIPGEHRFLSFLDELKGVGGIDLQLLDVQHHCVLELTDHYETFLAGLGGTTRRNFRYYRRRSESVGNVYVPEMDLNEFRIAAFSLLRKGVVGANSEGLNRALRMLEVAERRILVGLRGAQGEWLAIVGGWYEQDRAVVFCQMNNDTDYPHSSLCVVIRGYMFEDLIARSCHKVLFWAGVGGPLLRHCKFPPTTAVYVDRKTFLWRWFRRVVPFAVRFLPDRFSGMAHWVSPMALSKAG